MNEYVSLIIGASSGVVAFLATLGWMKHKQSIRRERRNDTRQGYLYDQRHEHDDEPVPAGQR